MKTYKVDLDYESFLFDPHYQENKPSYQKIIREFEYVFFLIEKENCNLKNIKGYEKKYLDNLKNLGFKIPHLTPMATEYDFWWGEHCNKEREMLLNSKLTSAKIAKDNSWGFWEGAIVENIEELKEHFGQFPHYENWIIKRPHGFSGIGHYVFQTFALDQNALIKIITEKVLLEPVYQRVFDIGTTFVIKEGKIEKQFMVENFNSTNGGFKGGAGASSVEKFKKYIWEKYTYSLEELEKITQEIAQIYMELGATSNIQIDSFVYREFDELKLYSLVEVNYRKTMGLVVQTIAEKEHHADWIEWRIETVRGVKEKKLDENWIKLSPEGNMFHSFFKSFIF